MSTPGFTLTLSARLDPPLDGETIWTVGMRVGEQHLGGRPVMTSHGEDEAGPGWASWTVIAKELDPDAAPDVLAVLDREVRAAVRAEGVTSFVVEELAATSVATLEWQARMRDATRLVGVEEFRELLARDGQERIGRTRFYELAATPEFPRPVRRGLWTRHQAVAYAAEARDRPRQGRPPKAGLAEG